MTRWELITSDEYISATVECIVVSKKSIIETRKELTEFFIDLRNELLNVEREVGLNKHHSDNTSSSIL